MKKLINIEYTEYNHWNQLDSNDVQLVNKAHEAMNSAYAPYSNFSVGASLRMNDNSIICGNNQENIAYPSGLCAERVALFYAGANFPNLIINKICIVAKGDLISIDSILSPCGGCRQVMAESENRQNKPIEVILVSQNNRVLVFESVLDLIPLAFNS
jgi:cytidine deaminase